MRKLQSAKTRSFISRLILRVWPLIIVIACFAQLYHWLSIVASLEYASILYFGPEIDILDTSTATTSTTSATTTTTLRHVVFGMSGNHPGFLAEFEVALKSVLLNAPSDPMTVHIIADGEAYEAVGDILNNKADLTSWYTPYPIHINIYNIEKLEEQWKKAVETRMEVAVNIAQRLKPGGGSLYRHTIGTYYRLFVDDVLRGNGVVDSALYLDTDVVVLAPLDGIWHGQVHNDHSSGYSNNNNSNNIKTLFYWGASQCAAFVVLRPGQMRRMWDLFLQVPESVIEDVLQPWPVVDDQFMLRVVNRHYPDMVGTLLPEWDVHAADGVWKFKRHLLLPNRPQGAGMLHFNGGGTSQDAYFKSHSHFTGNRIWGLARYYVDLPWTWARFQMTSRLSKKGQEDYHQIKVTTHHLSPNTTTAHV